MPTAAQRQEFRRLTALVAQRGAATSSPLLESIRKDGATVLTAAGFHPDPYQQRILGGPCFERLLLAASRQIGKSLCAGALALREALVNPGAKVLLVSAAQRQASELFNDKVMMLYNALSRPVPAARETAVELGLANGSRVISLPSTEATIRGFASVSLLVVDEAARVPDELIHAVRPMLAVSKGKMMLLSSAWARRGFFFRQWHESDDWVKVKVLATECGGRISPEFLEEERRVLGERAFAREYLVEWQEDEGAAFDFASVRAAMTAGGPPPLF